jgi:hypothetical protein
LVAPQRFATASGVGTPVERIHGWAPAASLTTGRSVLVPVGALRTFGGHNEDRAFEQTSAGTGAGGSQAEAVRRGLSTLLSYDGLRRALRHGAPVAEVTGQAFVGDPELTFLASSAENLGIQLELLRIGDPVGGPGQQALPVLLARCVDPETGCWRWAVGCDPDSTRAAVAAMRDLLGQVQLGREPGAEDGVDGGDPLFRDLDCGALTGFGEVNSLSGPVIGWQTVLERLRDSGRDVLVASEAAPDLRAGGISAARVLLVDGLDGTGVDGLDGNGVDGDEHVEGGDHGDR